VRHARLCEHLDKLPQVYVSFIASLEGLYRQGREALSLCSLQAQIKPTLKRWCWSDPSKLCRRRKGVPCSTPCERSSGKPTTVTGGRFSRTRMQESMRHSCRPKALSTSRDARTQTKDSMALQHCQCLHGIAGKSRRTSYAHGSTSSAVHVKRFPSASKNEEASTRAAVLASALGKFSRKPHLLWMLLNQNRDIVSIYLDSAHDQTSLSLRTWMLTQSCVTEHTLLW
jgi:hypothetical protein